MTRLRVIRRDSSIEIADITKSKHFCKVNFTKNLEENICLIKEMNIKGLWNHT